MKIDIRPNMLISEVQKIFNSMFPYLKLEFFMNQKDMSKGKRMNGNRSVGEAQGEIIESSFEIQPEMTVKELESAFKKNFSLTVQVFRQSGNTWLQTTITDSWTLKVQNDHGREISTDNISERQPPIDYDLDRDPSR